MTSALFATGLVCLLAQVVILRELTVASFGTELVYLFAFALWLGGGAAGAWLSRLPIFSRPGAIPGLFTAAAVLTPLEAVLIRGGRDILGITPGTFPSLGEQFLTAAAGVLPVAVAAGLLFPLAAAGFRRDGPGGGPLGRAYAVEGLGGLIGALAATLSPAAGLSNLSLSFLTALTAAAAALWTGPRGSGGGLSRLAALSVALAALAVLFFTGPLDRATTRWNHPHLAAVRDTPYGRVTVALPESQVVFFFDDALLYESEGTEAEAFIHPAALQHPSPRRVLLLGGGVQGMVTELLHHGPEAVDHVEIDPFLLETAAPYLPAPLRASLADPRVRTLYADPRRHLASGPQYDLIVVAMPEPLSGWSNGFYTEEFFRLCRRALNPGGVLALRLEGAENLWTGVVAMKMASVHRALGDVFPAVVFLPGGTNVVTASDAPLPTTAEEPTGRWRQRGIPGRLVTPPYLAYLYENDRFRRTRDLLAAFGDTPPNRDARPVSYRFTAMLWLSRFVPAASAPGFARDLEKWIYRVGPAAGLLAMAALAAASFGPRRSFPAVLAAVAGFNGMLAEGVLIMHYQIKTGILFQDVGLLLMSFMGGLALGAWSLSLRPPSGRAIRALVVAQPFFFLLLGLAVLRGLPAGLPSVALALGAAGWFVGALFAAAAHLRAGDVRAAASALYGADLLGGALAALLGGVLLIPFWGLYLPLAGAALGALCPAAALLGRRGTPGA